MKSLVYKEGEWRYLDCSLMGSYYIPCEIVESHEDDSKTIKYYDEYSEEYVTEDIPVEEIEIYDKGEVLKIKLKEGKPTEGDDGLYVLQIQKEAQFWYLEGNKVWAYPHKNRFIYLNDICCYGYCKIDLEII
jgi:hypothetical protein